MKKTVKLILIIFWMGLIFYFSQQSGNDSSDLSDGLLYNIINIFTNDPKIILYYLDILGTPIRKLAHFSEYAILGLLVATYLKEYQLDNKKIILYALVFCFLYACSDEIHQLFIPNRAGTFTDVLIDTSGSMSTLLIYYLWLKRSR